MIIKRAILFMICTISTINAMEVETVPKKVYHLALLPPEILNHIASYLPFNNIESDDAFIERTWALGTISQEHSDLVQKHDQPCISAEELEATPKKYRVLFFLRDHPRAYSVNGSKIISLKKITNNPKVTIFDIRNNTITENIKLAELSKDNITAIEHIALSTNGTHYATQYELKKYERSEGEVAIMSCKNYLIIKNIFSDDKQEFLIPGYYGGVISIGFNKQGTKIIVHAKEIGVWVEPTKLSLYHIFPLTTPEEHEEKSKKTLKEYLRHIGCCKDLAKNLPGLK